ncbi:hypothetical protein AeNC1_014396 [Aphanomyces euteiches]|nr:hypothetical protein AeNC1_014396 [Aphanomyces euteiches]
MACGHPKQARNLRAYASCVKEEWHLPLALELHLGFELVQDHAGLGFCRRKHQEIVHIETRIAVAWTEAKVNNDLAAMLKPGKSRLLQAIQRLDQQHLAIITPLSMNAWTKAVSASARRTANFLASVNQGHACANSCHLDDGREYVEVRFVLDNFARGICLLRVCPSAADQFAAWWKVDKLPHAGFAQLLQFRLLCLRPLVVGLHGHCLAMALRDVNRWRHG